MLAGEADAPFSDPTWLFEVKWDGIRALSRDGRLWSRRGVEIAARFPEVAACLPPGVALDGELVVAVGGRPDFDAAMDRFRLSEPQRIARAAAARPATYIVFDRPDLDDLCQAERRRRLVADVAPGARLRVNAAVDGDGLALWAAVRKQEWEGMVAKRKDGMYKPGKRTDAWLKVKNRRVFEGVITAAHGDGYLVVAGRTRPDRPVATVIAGVPRDLFRAVRDGASRLPLPCRVSHVGQTYRGRLREPILLP